MPSLRQRKINSLVQEELGKIISEELELPPDILVTIANVVTAPDLKHAKVSITVNPKIKTPSSLRLLENNVYKLQKGLNKRLVLRYVPKIRFVIDDVQDKLDRVENLLKQAKHQDSEKQCFPKNKSKKTD